MTENHTRIDELIERSSLGTPGARRLRHRTPPAVAQDLLDEPSTMTAETREAVALLNAAVDHDQETAHQVVALIRPLVLRYCRARVQRGDLAIEQTDEIADAVCAEFEQNLITDPDLADEPKILSHAYRIANRHVTAANERTEAEVRDESGHPLRVKYSGALAAAVDQLDDVKREIIVLRVVVGLSATETADVLGLRPATVRVLQHAALRTLRRTLDM
ncbi:sigma factor-like helix-turn-helix DNA-binding protein [Pseudonocardia sichuanensis]